LLHVAIAVVVADCVSKATALIESEKNIQTIQREVASASREQKTRKAEQESKDAKLNRALEEIDRLKAQLKSDELNFRETLEASKQEKERLLIENRRLSKHRADLINAFKKQMKLIDVLKRQKLHLEAAKVLSFTEEEFAKTLEYGDM
jgi:septal ring factor EnvC (AmiA/AmiB activator)